ncbi:endonuclease MutS2 [bacterium]|nr:endonuclease MutS2 [bacterium]
MDEKSLQILDYPKMLTLAASLAATERGRREVESLSPQLDKLLVENLLSETKEGIEFLQAVGSALVGVKMIDEAIASSRILGSMLQPESLLDIASTLHVCQRLVTRFSKLEAALPRLKRRVSLIAPLPEITSAIERVVAPNGEIRDNASAELRRIRIKVSSTQRKIKDTLESILRSGAGGAVQDQYVTVRDGRYVLPVKSEMRSTVGGVIHDQSASGATIFVEPKETIDLNNRVRQLQIEERHEIERILRVLTQDIGECADDLSRNIGLLAAIDCILARARFSSLLDAKMPQISDDTRLVLKGARHPLLVLGQKGFRGDVSTLRPADEGHEHSQEESSADLSRRFLFEKEDEAPEDEKRKPDLTVVPIDMAIGGDYRTLVITGPNTGGKTVSLKTAGLLPLLAQTGFHIPADEGSQVPIYQNVFADIGDEQGIEQSLSTFSSHMTQIVKIVKNLAPQSLVLLDEIGAGTDPAEGSALAIALLKHLTESDVHTIATTHHSSIKVFAHSTPGVKNASVQFDAVSLVPTYKLVIGLPGSSNAFQIAGRLGLPDELVAEAKSSLSVESSRVSELLAFLDEQQSVVEAKSKELTQKTRATTAMQAELEKSVSFAKERSQHIIDAANKEAKDLVKKAKSEIRSMMASLRGKQSAETMDGSDVDRARTRLGALDRELATKGKKKAKRSKPAAEQLTIDTIRKGMNVRMEGLDVHGVVSNVFKSKGEVEVLFDGIRVRSKVEGLSPAAAPRKLPTEEVRPVFAKGSASPKPELMLIGMKRDEALVALEKYMDQALLWDIRQVRIVHGFGKGVLQAAVAESLSENPAVADFRAAPQNQGGAGATVVVFKE